MPTRRSHWRATPGQQMQLGAEAEADAKEAVAVTRETGPAFMGPFALGTLALATGDPAVRQAALEEGEALLRKGAVGHNHLLLRRDAIDACLDAGDWDGAERFAAALEDYTSAEKLAFSDFYIARARALAAHGRRATAAAVPASELERLRDTGERLGLRVALPQIDAAIRESRG
jgi:hypothetical protein